MAKRRRGPANDDRVDRIGADGEDKAGNIASRRIERAGGHDKPDDRDGEADRDVPRALMVSSGTPSKENARGAGEDERRAG